MGLHVRRLPFRQLPRAKRSGANDAGLCRPPPRWDTGAIGMRGQCREAQHVPTTCAELMFLNGTASVHSYTNDSQQGEIGGA
jgi:hypothetical protein